MARLRAHGGAYGKVECGNTRYAVTADNMVLKDRGGSGYKVAGKSRYATPEATLSAMVENRREAAFAPFWDVLEKLVSFRQRSLVTAAVELLPGDVDGLWAELNDAGIALSFEECEELAAAYRASVKARVKRVG